MVAKHELEWGFIEDENNITPYGQWYGMNGSAWCAMFVSYCAYQARIIDVMVPKFAWCPDGVKWYQILRQCRPLYEYSWFIQAIKDYMAGGKNRDEAIVRAMTDCEHEGILVDFLREHGTEAVNMLFTEFNMEDALEVRFEEGKAEGKAEDILDLLTDMGEVSEELKGRVLAEEDMQVLKRCLRLAAKAESVEIFEHNM